MKLFKKILLIGICIFAMGSVTACGNNNATSKNEAENKETIMRPMEPTMNLAIRMEMEPQTAVLTELERETGRM